MRVGNQAFEHVQNDVYGEMVLAISRLFLDMRFVGSVPPRTAIETVEGLIAQIEARVDEPDAGPWEFRDRTRLHTFTVLMHWAGARRAVEVAEALGATELAERARKVEQRAAELLETQCWNDEIGALTQVAGEPQLDAVNLLAVHVGYLDADDPRSTSHVDAIREALSVNGGLLRRYANRDDFGQMEAAFTVCSFWLVEALALARANGRSPRPLRAAVVVVERPRPLLRGHPPGHARAVGQLPADLLTRRADQRRVPAVAPLGLSRS